MKNLLYKFMISILLLSPVVFGFSYANASYHDLASAGAINSAVITSSITKPVKKMLSTYASLPKETIRSYSDLGESTLALYERAGVALINGDENGNENSSHRLAMNNQGASVFSSIGDFLRRLLGIKELSAPVIVINENISAYPTSYQKPPTPQVTTPTAPSVAPAPAPVMPTPTPTPSTSIDNVSNNISYITNVGVTESQVDQKISKLDQDLRILINSLMISAPDINNFITYRTGGGGSNYSSSFDNIRSRLTALENAAPSAGGNPFDQSLDTTDSPTFNGLSLSSLSLTGAFNDGSSSSGTLGFILQSTGTSTRWVATSTLGITSGGSSVFALDGSNNIYSSNAGTSTSGTNLFLVGNNAGYDAVNAIYSNFIGSNAGSSATNVSESNFLGLNAGNSATNANSSNFLGSSAGFNATNANDSNFFGYGAGANAEIANFSNFFGNFAGHTAINANNSNFFGPSAGHTATNANDSNFFGSGAGFQATNASSSNFFGYNTGYNATNAANSNFFGNNSGSGATNATNSNFFGNNAGINVTNAFSSNFFGNNSGNGATNANDSNFFGDNTGFNATNASSSNFIGSFAGYFASNAYESNFLGNNAGTSASDAHHSNFLGSNSGLGASSANNSNFFGNNTGVNASAANNSNFFGADAGTNSAAANDSNFFGHGAGKLANNAANSNFLGNNAGSGASNAPYSNFFGNSAGEDATGATNSNFFGSGAGFEAFNSSDSNFFGMNAGAESEGASHSNFFGSGAGEEATDAANSNFFGNGAGALAENASFATFIGSSAGSLATNARDSIFIGSSAGVNDAVDNTSNSGTSIAIGRRSGTGGFSDSISLGHGVINSTTTQANIGNVIYATGIYNSDTQSSAPTAGGAVGIGTSSTALGPLVMASGAHVTTGGTWTNASDKNIKENFTELDRNDILNKILELPITQWNYIKEENSNMHIGPMAQDFFRIFGLGGSDTSISTIDPAGVALAGIQALSSKVASSTDLVAATLSSLNIRLASLEGRDPEDMEGDSDSVFLNVLTTLKSFGSEVVDGIAYIKNMFVKNLTVGSKKRPSGITLYDQATGDPYCVVIVNGKMKNKPGECPEVSEGDPPYQDDEEENDEENEEEDNDNDGDSENISNGDSIAPEAEVSEDTESAPKETSVETSKSPPEESSPPPVKSESSSDSGGDDGGGSEGDSGGDGGGNESGSGT